MRETGLLILILLSLGLSAQCVEKGEANPLIVSEASDRIVCREPDGKVVTVKKFPRRVVIAYVSLIGLWYCAGGEVIAIPSTMNMDCIPEEAKDLERIGRFNSPNLEKILQLTPDLVLLVDRVGKHHETRELLSSCGIDTLMLAYENYGDFVELLDLFCRINGKSPKDGRAAKVTDGVKVYTERCSGRKGPRFLSMQYASRGFNADTNRAHVAYMATMLGGRNVIGENIAGKDGKRIKVSLERVVMEDPEMIFVSSPSRLDEIRKEMEREFAANAAWREVSAVRNGKVFFLPHDLFMYRPNEDFPEAFRRLSEIMYPEEVKKD